VEVCGDGFNYGQYQCDDGNLIDGDGCSRYCMIEEGFACSGGTELTADTCYDVRHPIPTLELINSQNNIYITFDEEVTLTGDFEDNIEVTVSGPQDSYDF